MMRNTYKSVFSYIQMLGTYSKKEAEELARFFISVIKEGNVEILQKKHFLQTRGLVLRILHNGKILHEFFRKPGEQSIGKILIDISKQVKELKDDFKLELHILHDFQKTNINKLDTSKGLYCNYVSYSAYLLPQNLEKIRYAEKLCQKASLPNDAWQRDGFELYEFMLERFEFDVGEMNK